MIKQEVIFEALKNAQIIDLTQTLEEHMPKWVTHPHFFHTLWHSYWHGDEAVDYQLLINEHHGTHVDSQGHMIKSDEYNWIDSYPLNKFMGECVVIHKELEPGEEITARHIKDWEAENEPIKEGDVVFFDFGWAKKWHKRPDANEFATSWPGLGTEAGEYLASRNVALVGVDTLAAEPSGVKNSPVHKILLGKGILIVENLCNLDQINERCFFVGVPLKIKEGSGSPIRAFAMKF